jgi:hypothetical protein
MFKYNSFPEDISILTQKGFVEISKINNDDLICIKNKTGFIEYQNVKYIIKQEYKGTVYNLVNNNIDLYALPDFQIQSSPENKMIAIDYPNIHEESIQKWIAWKCDKPVYKSYNWLHFLAYFHCSGRIVNDIIIIDNVYNHVNLYNVLLKMPFKWRTLINDSIIIEDEIIVEYVKRYHFNGQRLKVPEKLKMSNVMQILAFLKILFNNNWNEYYTSDFDYISDIQHLLIKSGSNANIYSRFNSEYRLIHCGNVCKFPKPIKFEVSQLNIYQFIFDLDYIPSICIRKNGKVIVCNTAYNVEQSM